MSLSKNRALMIPLKPEGYKTTDQFIKQWLMQKRIDERSSFETMLLFESLFQDMIEQGYGQDTISSTVSCTFQSTSADRIYPKTGKRFLQ